MASCEKPVIIYALTEPDTLEVRYVGQTRHLFRRYAWHLTARRDNSAKAQWIKALESRAALPGIRVLELVTKEEVNARECWWIEYWQNQGAALLNSAQPMFSERRDTAAWTIRLSKELITIVKTNARREGNPPSEVLERMLLIQTVRELHARVQALEYTPPLLTPALPTAPAAARKDVQQWTIRLSKALIDHLKAIAYERRIPPSQLIEELVWKALNDR
jgi:predicted DNA binding CopG/RHH family protein